jgi:hypothetical protein
MDHLKGLLTDVRALRLIAGSFAAFHAASAALEPYSYFKGTSSAILANIAARVIIAFLFWRFSRTRGQ